MQKKKFKVTPLERAWILYDVGNDYMTIYQEGRDRYIVSDIYSLKFIEFYDTRCRDICDEVLRSGWMPNQGM